MGKSLAALCCSEMASAKLKEVPANWRERAFRRLVALQQRELPSFTWRGEAEACWRRFVRRWCRRSPESRRWHDATWRLHTCWTCLAEGGSFRSIGGRCFVASRWRVASGVPSRSTGLRTGGFRSRSLAMGTSGSKGGERARSQGGTRREIGEACRTCAAGISLIGERSVRFGERSVRSGGRSVRPGGTRIESALTRVWIGEERLQPGALRIRRYT